ncbi:MAG: ribonuclease P protein component [Dehalococcoidia bacterium]
MRRQQRLRRRQDFAAVYRTGKVYAAGPLVLRVQQNPDTPVPRFGFAVGKRLGGAVVRNRLKRRLREAARLSGARGTADVVVIARAPARHASYQELERTLRSLLRRAGMVLEEEEA